MLQSLGYDYVVDMAIAWFGQLSPVLVFLGAVALMLTLAGFGLALLGTRSDGAASAPSGLDTKLR